MEANACVGVVGWDNLCCGRWKVLQGEFNWILHKPFLPSMLLSADGMLIIVLILCTYHPCCWGWVSIATLLLLMFFFVFDLHILFNMKANAFTRVLDRKRFNKSYLFISFKDCKEGTGSSETLRISSCMLKCCLSVVHFKNKRIKFPCADYMEWTWILILVWVNMWIHQYFLKYSHVWTKTADAGYYLFS